MPARDDGAAVGAEGGPAPPDVAHRVAEPGAGRPLPEAVRAFMEPRFGRDFSAVRVHDSPEDRHAARRIGARAFTHREHVWIGPDESASDRKLMAHELTHVVQQTAPGPAKAAARAAETGEPQLRRGYIRNKAEKYARNIPGYRLICLIIGKSPITGDTVERNAVNVLGAMMSLIPGGNLLFERLEESRVIEEAFEWVWTRLLQLNITWTRIKGLISDLIDYLPDWPSDVIDYAIKLFKPLVDDILTFIRDVVGKILEFIVRGALRLAGPWGEKVWEIIQAAGAVLMTILEDPLGFAKNLFSAVIKGFKQFGSNIWEHIKNGLLGWLFGTLKGLDLEMPERLDFKGLISIGLQIVGLTYANFRAIMVKKLGANGERKMTFIEKSVEAVKILVKEGFVGMWQRVFQMIDNFRETVLGGIRDFVINSLIMGGISWLAGLSNPVGAVIKVVLSIYNMIVTFLERLDQILEVAQLDLRLDRRDRRRTHPAGGRLHRAHDGGDDPHDDLLPRGAGAGYRHHQLDPQHHRQAARRGEPRHREARHLRRQEGEEAVLQADRQAQQQAEAAFGEFSDRKHAASHLRRESRKEDRDADRVGRRKRDQRGRPGLCRRSQENEGQGRCGRSGRSRFRGQRS